MVWFVVVAVFSARFILRQVMAWVISMAVWFYARRVGERWLFHGLAVVVGLLLWPVSWLKVGVGGTACIAWALGKRRVELK